MGRSLPRRKRGEAAAVKTRTAGESTLVALSPAFRRLKQRAAEKQVIDENQSTLRYSKYAFVTYWSIMRSVLKNEPFNAIALRITRTNWPRRS